MKKLSRHELMQYGTAIIVPYCNDVHISDFFLVCTTER